MSGVLGSRPIIRALGRTAGAVVLAVTVGVFSATPVSAAPDHRVTGAVSGTAPFAFGVAGCFIVHQNYIGTITTSKGATASINVDVCFHPPGTITGTFVISTSKGQVTGSVTGTLSAAPGTPVTFAFDLLVVSSEDGLAKRGSTLHFDGTWTSNLIDGGPFTGTVTS